VKFIRISGKKEFVHREEIKIITCFKGVCFCKSKSHVNEIHRSNVPHYILFCVSQEEDY
jgi:hypothetical protein